VCVPGTTSVPRRTRRAHRRFKITLPNTN